jgi:hypothetical protein
VTDIAGGGPHNAEVLALKERFASENAVYLSEALAYRRRQGDWKAVGRLAHLGFGPNPEFTRALIEVRRACGDEAGAQQAQIDDFLQEPTAPRFVELKRRSEALGTWTTPLGSGRRSSWPRAGRARSSGRSMLAGAGSASRRPSSSRSMLSPGCRRVWSCLGSRGWGSCETGSGGRSRSSTNGCD